MCDSAVPRPSCKTISVWLFGALTASAMARLPADEEHLAAGGVVQGKGEARVRWPGIRDRIGQRYRA